MADGIRHITKPLPVLIGNDEHIMAKAEVFQKPDSVLIQITASGYESQLLAEFLVHAEHLALSFSAKAETRTQ